MVDYFFNISTQSIWKEGRKFSDIDAVSNKLFGRSTFVESLYQPESKLNALNVNRDILENCRYVTFDMGCSMMFNFSTENISIYCEGIECFKETIGTTTDNKARVRANQAMAKWRMMGRSE